MVQEPLPMCNERLGAAKIDPPPGRGRSNPKHDPDHHFTELLQYEGKIGTNCNSCQCSAVESPKYFYSSFNYKWLLYFVAAIDYRTCRRLGQINSVINRFVFSLLLRRRSRLYKVCAAPIIVSVVRVLK